MKYYDKLVCILVDHLANLTTNEASAVTSALHAIILNQFLMYLN